MAELREDEARCGFESLVPDAVAAAGFAVPCYTASGAGDNTVRLWGVDDGECKRVLEGHSNEVLSVNIGYVLPNQD